MLSLTARQFGQRPSRLLGLRDDVVGLDFDQLCAYAAQEFDDERERARLEAIGGSGVPEVVYEEMMPRHN